jgi:sugar phosphate isomerase/epimerase
MLWLMKDVNLPNVKVGWDAWSPTVEGLSQDEIRQSILKMQPYLVNTIAAQYIRQPRYHYDPSLINYTRQQDLLRATSMTDPEGIIDYKPFIATLRQIGYRGYMVYEMCAVLDGGGSIENLDRNAKEFLKFCQQSK